MAAIRDLFVALEVALPSFHAAMTAMDNKYVADRYKTLKEAHDRVHDSGAYSWVFEETER